MEEIQTISSSVDSTVIIEVKRRGRPRKYNSEEEAKEAQMEQIKIAYEKKNGHPPGSQRRGPKPKYLTIEEYREAANERSKQRKLNKKNEK